MERRNDKQGLTVLLAGTVLAAGVAIAHQLYKGINEELGDLPYAEAQGSKGYRFKCIEPGKVENEVEKPAQIDRDYRFRCEFK